MADFVEVSYHAKNPLYTNLKLRNIGHAASQFVLGRTNKKDVTEAGATPKQLVTGDYTVVPLHTVDNTKAYALDYSGYIARADVMPTRGKPMQLTEAQSANLKRSMDTLTILNNNMSEDNIAGHCVAYIMSYSTLVNNPQSVEHFVERVSETSVGGVVDFSMIDDLALDANGEQAGHFVVVNACVGM